MPGAFVQALLFSLPLASLLAVAGSAVAQDRSTSDPPWRERSLTREVGLGGGARLLPAEGWPAEPDSPAEIDSERFQRALYELCLTHFDHGRSVPSVSRVARHLLRYGREFGQDPFLLAALFYQEGSCEPGDGEDGLYGPLRFPLSLFRRDYSDGRYRYFVLEGEHTVERRLRLDRFELTAQRLRDPEAAIYFAAAYLRVLEEQHSAIERFFPHPAHRHPVEHYLLGDRPRGGRLEDRLLITRRRLLQGYGAHPSPPPLSFSEVELGMPLDGAPRMVMSGMGRARAGGRRRHRGVDIDADYGEPVYAMADGEVQFAGLQGRRGSRLFAPEEIPQPLPRRVGAGGLFVCISHGRGRRAFRTCYMHLSRYLVQRGDRVTRGQRIGSVGRSGVHESPTHLHLEVHAGRPLDISSIIPSAFLGHDAGRGPGRRPRARTPEERRARRRGGRSSRHRSRRRRATARRSHRRSQSRRGH